MLLPTRKKQITNTESELTKTWILSLPACHTNTTVTDQEKFKGFSNELDCK